MITASDRKANRKSSAQSDFHSPLSWAQSGRESAYREPFQTGEINSVRDPLRPEIRLVANAKIDYLSNLLRQLAEVMQDSRADEDDERPTQAAFEEAIALLLDTTIELAMHDQFLPRGRATTDSNGALRIEWRRPDACVLVVIPRPHVDQGTYLYRERGHVYDVEHGVSPRALVNALKQLEQQVSHQG